jgi:hypothetical protein
LPPLRLESLGELPDGLNEWRKAGLRHDNAASNSRIGLSPIVGPDMLSKKLDPNATIQCRDIVKSICKYGLDRVRHKLCDFWLLLVLVHLVRPYKA